MPEQWRTCARKSTLKTMFAARSTANYASKNVTSLLKLICTRSTPLRYTSIRDVGHLCFFSFKKGRLVVLFIVIISIVSLSGNTIKEALLTMSWPLNCRGRKQISWGHHLPKIRKRGLHNRRGVAMDSSHTSSHFCYNFMLVACLMRIKSSDWPKNILLKSIAELCTVLRQCNPVFV